MNENNQPQSQQTKRERGLYHVKRNGYWTVAEYTDHHGQWRVFNNTDQMQSRDFEEIDERRIERSSLDKWTEDWFKNHVNQQAERIKELEAYIQKLLDDGDNEARIADFHQRLP